MADNDNDYELRCIILTLKKENVLIPSAVVAEIISVEDVDKIENSPEWLVGNFKWRGEEIPLLSYEAGSDANTVSTARSTQVAVLYVLNEDSGLESSYIGLMISGVPHVSRFTSDQIIADEDVVAEHAMVAQHVKVNGVSMSILDIDAMETLVVEANI